MARRSHHRLTPLLLLPALLAAPGCIIDDIHEGIVLANHNLTSINDSFAEVERANELLAELNEKLVTLDSVNERLASIDALLVQLEDAVDGVEPPLAEIEVHLASLRRTINNIDSTIPFLSVSGDDEDEQEALEQEHGEHGEAETAPDGEPPANGTAD